MATILTPDDKPHGYVISQKLNQGRNAISYLAEKDGVRYFFKQYSNPTWLKSWYEGYIDYQDSIKQVITGKPSQKSERSFEKPPIAEYCSDLIEYFKIEDDKKLRAYYQVLEFFQDGKSLKDCLNEQQFCWENRIICAKTLMSGMTRLHEAGVVHTDLKPDNLYMIPNKKRPGFRCMKIIDFDFSILANKKAPWDGIDPYVGTPGYLSPEHLKGQVHQFKSDVFTCGIILYELLTKQGHPYDYDEAEYAKNVERYTAQEPSLLGTFGNKEWDKRVCAMLRRMLAPKLEDRPSAVEVREVLLGK